MCRLLLPRSYGGFELEFPAAPKIISALSVGAELPSPTRWTSSPSRFFVLCCPQLPRKKSHACSAFCFP